MASHGPLYRSSSEATFQKGRCGRPGRTAARRPDKAISQALLTRSGQKTLRTRNNRRFSMAISPSVDETIENQKTRLGGKLCLH